MSTALILNPWFLGLIFTGDGTIDDLNVYGLVLFVTLCSLLGGLQLIARWVEPLAWGHPVGLLRGGAFVAVFAGLIAGTWTGLAKFDRGHSHTIVIPAEIENATPEQRQWAEDFYQRSLAAALRNGWFDIDNALAQGFQPDRVNRTHYPHLEYMFDGIILDPERPEWLVYHDSPNGKVLMALMFFTNELLEEGPTPAGPIAQWHYHPYFKLRCAVKGIWTVGDADDEGRCKEGIPVDRTPEMFHVWFIEHPLGRFTEMKIVPEPRSDEKFDRKLLHPIAVHFVIALFVVSVLVDAAGRIFRNDSLHFAGWINLALAVVAGIASVSLGLSAEVSLRPTPEGHETLDIHKLLAFASLAIILVLFAWRYGLRGRFPGRGAALYLVVGLTGIGVIGATGYYGGEMVYRHGSAVRIVDTFLRERYWERSEHVYRKAEPPVPDRPGVY